MKENYIYLDHAATSFPKPPEVLRAVQQCMQRAGGNPGRGSHKLAALAAEEIYACRELAGLLFDASPEKVVCTSGATMGLNLALSGMLHSGDHVLLDNLAHNAVYRPVYLLRYLFTPSAPIIGSTGASTFEIRSIHERTCSSFTRSSSAYDICHIVHPPHFG